MKDTKIRVFQMVILAIVLLGSLISITTFVGQRESERVWNYKTPEQWALESAKEDFFYIRESDEIYFYTIKKLTVGNIGKIEGDYFDLFEIVMTDDGGNEERYLFAIEYNLDNHFMAKFKRFGGSHDGGKIGKEHIVWADLDEF